VAAEAAQSRASADGPAAPLVEAGELAAGYGGPPAIEGVGFALRAGQRIGVLGPNGGGKSTLFGVLLGELAPARGTLAVAARCASVPQTERSRLDYPVSALDVALMGTIARLAWWRRPGRAERRGALEALGRVGLADLAGAPFGELSGGQRQRVLVARALVQDARVLLLDEPYTGLDAPSAERLTLLIDELAGEGRGLMIATHDAEQARDWDLVMCLNRRMVAFGPPAEALTREALEATYAGEIVELPGEGGERRRGLLPPHHHDHP
jgi:ABC-type Mn2+/Zn2+ transport system ATPase subunit